MRICMVKNGSVNENVHGGTARHSPKASPSSTVKPTIAPPLRRGPAYSLARPPAISEGESIVWQRICGYTPKSITKGGFLYVTDQGNIIWKVAWWDFGAASWSFNLRDLAEVEFVAGSWEQKAENPWAASLRTQAVLHTRNGATLTLVPPLIGHFLLRASELLSETSPNQAIAQAAHEIASGELRDPTVRKGVDRVTVHSSNGLSILAAIAFVATLGLFVPVAYALAGGGHPSASGIALLLIPFAVPMLAMWALVFVGLAYRYRRRVSNGD